MRCKAIVRDWPLLQVSKRECLIHFLFLLLTKHFPDQPLKKFEQSAVLAHIFFFFFAYGFQVSTL
jgi:hypothetical protein